LRIRVTAAMWMAWLSWRLPRRDSRWIVYGPDDASIGAVPVKAAKRAAVGNRVTSAGVAQDDGGHDGADAEDLRDGVAAAATT
jgi:hypothetical protein